MTPTFDSNGYPSEWTLDAIATWQYPFDGLMDFVKEAWSDMGIIHEDVLDDSIFKDRNGIDVYKLATGGWSGNEEIISALQRNAIFWSMHWESSHRGGLTILRL